MTLAMSLASLPATRLARGQFQPQALAHFVDALAPQL
jgi:hypothetical protein